jgi:hypothetical protein
LYLALPREELSAILNSMIGDDQAVALKEISDPELLRGLADDIESRLARNALLYRKAYDQTVAGLPRTISGLLLPKPVPNHYAILGLPRGAGPDIVKKSGRYLMMLFHPDRNPGDKAADTRYKEVVTALEVMDNEERRREYDRSLPQRASSYPSVAWMDRVPKAT